VFIKEGQEVHFCKLCGGAAAVADACKANSKCVAFVMEDEKCGYLKASVVASAQYRSQPETLYCMSSQPDCTGGRPCSAVTRASAPYCSFKDAVPQSMCCCLLSLLVPLCCTTHALMVNQVMELLTHPFSKIVSTLLLLLLQALSTFSMHKLT
jgi:hypothetical protein